MGPVLWPAGVHHDAAGQARQADERAPDHRRRRAPARRARLADAREAPDRAASRWHRSSGSLDQCRNGRDGQAVSSAIPVGLQPIQGACWCPSGSYGHCIGAFVHCLADSVPAQGETVTHLAQIAEQTIIVVTIVAIVAAVMLAFFITRSITVSLSFAVSATEAVARGDLTQQINTHGKDETGRLLRALSEMNASLLRVVGHVRTGC